MPLTSFCGLLTLQVGAAVLSAVFFTIAGAITAANAFGYSNEQGGFPVNIVLMVIFIIGLIIAALLMFASSYAESRTLAIASVALIILLTCYWTILCCFSFVNDPTHIKNICIQQQRCPESFWIALLSYRKYNNEYISNQTSSGFYKDDPYIYELKVEPYYEDHKSKDSNQGHIHLQSNIVNNEYYEIYDSALINDEKTADNDDYKNKEVKVQYTNEYSGLPFVGAVILFVVNLFFLIFSALVMWSWASELDWADYYIEDDPVIVYEEPYTEPF